LVHEPDLEGLLEIGRRRGDGARSEGQRQERRAKNDRAKGLEHDVFSFSGWISPYA
jgi:hypothetical protein